MKKAWYILLQFELLLAGLFLIFIDHTSIGLVGLEMSENLRNMGLIPILSTGGYCFAVSGLATFVFPVRRFLSSNRITSYLIPAQLTAVFALLAMEIVLRIVLFTEPIARVNTNWFGELPADGTHFYWASEGFSITKYDGLPGEIHTPYTGGRNIVVLGDSLVEGLPTSDDQKIASELETMLRKDGECFDVHNLGRSGHSIADYTVNIPKYIHMYDPVVIAILLYETDFIESMDSSRDNYFTRDQTSRLETVSKFESIETPFRVSEPFLTLRPMLIISGYNRLSQMKQLAHKSSRVEEIPYQGMDEELGKMQLDALVEACDGIPLVLINFPYIPFAEGNEIRFHEEDYEKLNSIMASQSGFTYIDSMPVFRQHIESGQLPIGFINGPTFAWGHLNGFGSQVVARLLREEIKKVVE